MAKDVDYRAFQKILDATGWSDKFWMLVQKEDYSKTYHLSDETFVEILNEKGLIPGFSGSSGDTIQNISFDSSTSELTITTDVQTYSIALQQFYKVDTIAERDALIVSVGETPLTGAQVYVANTSGDSGDPQPKTYRYDGSNVWTIIGEGSGGSVAFDGNRTVTRSGLPAINAGGSSITEWANNYFFPAEDPTIALTGGTILEFGASTSREVNYTITKKTYGIDTASITQFPSNTPIIIGANIDEDSDPNGNQQTGSENLTLDTPAEPSVDTQVQETISADVEDNQGNTDTASTTFTWRHGAYRGTLGDSDGDGGGTAYSVLADVTGTPPTDAAILSLTKTLTTTRTGTFNNFGGGGEFTVFAWPTLFGTPSFIVNGLPNTAWTKVRSAFNFTNAEGFTQPYDVWVSNTVQNSPSNIQIQ